MAMSPDAGERRLFFRLFYHAMKINPKALKPALFSFINGMASRNVMKAVVAQEAGRLARHQAGRSVRTSPTVTALPARGRMEPASSLGFHG
jgi:hypothetical protein